MFTYNLIKSEVGMAVLKSKQTRLVGLISTYMYVVHCFFNIIMDCERERINTNGYLLQFCVRKASVGMYNVCADYP